MSVIGRRATPDSAAALATAGAIRIIRRGSNGVGIRYSGPKLRVAPAYAGATLSFGPEYLIPTPFDPRLMMRIAPAVAKAAAESGVALRPITDMEAYRAKLQTFVYASGAIMRPIFNLAKAAKKKRIAYAEGEEERILRAVQVVVDENVARPTLIGRPEVIRQRIAKFGLRLQAERDYDLVNTENDHRYRSYWQMYHEMTARKDCLLYTSPSPRDRQKSR